MCQTKCLPQGHEHERASPGLKANRSLGSRPSLLACSWLWTSPSAAQSVALAKLIHMQPTMMEQSCSRHARTRRRHTPNSLPLGRCKLVVLAMETGGRWSKEAVQTLQMLAHSKARDVPPYMQFSVALMWERRWTRMLAIACAVSFASSLVEPARNASWCRTDGETPLLAALFEGDPR